MGPVNIEIKARCADHAPLRAILEAHRARYIGQDHQVDTYFKVPDGRLKLRQGNIENSLIHYRRWRLANFRASGEPSPFRLSVHLAGLREREAALAGLREAHRQRDPWMVYLHSFDAFADLRDDPEFRSFVDQLGFPQPTDDLVSRIADRF